VETTDVETSKIQKPHQTCNLVIETQAAEIVQLRERIRSLEADVEAYRELASIAINQVREMTLRGEQQRETYERLVDEYRGLREQLLQKATAA
jgi:hypothetical protein